MDDVVNVLNLCGAFDLREAHNEFSLWFPPKFGSETWLNVEIYSIGNS